MKTETLKSIPAPEISCYDLCRSIIDKLWDKDDMDIDSVLVARYMFSEFPNGNDPTIAYHAFKDFKQISRQLLRSCFRDKEESSEQLNLFGGVLQTRYPTKKNNEDSYTRLADMTDDEIELNITRLEKESKAKASHARCLRNYKRTRQQQAA